MSDISERVREYLNRKLKDCKEQLSKLNHRRKVIKVLYISTVLSSIIISTVVVSLTSIISVPIIVITTLSMTSAILTGVSVHFNFHSKKVAINNLIKKF